MALAPGPEPPEKPGQRSDSPESLRHRHLLPPWPLPLPPPNVVHGSGGRSAALPALPSTPVQYSWDCPGHPRLGAKVSPDGTALCGRQMPAAPGTQASRDHPHLSRLREGRWRDGTSGQLP